MHSFVIPEYKKTVVIMKKIVIKACLYGYINFGRYPELLLHNMRRLLFSVAILPVLEFNIIW